MNVIKRLADTIDTERRIHDGLRLQPHDGVLTAHVFVRGDIDDAMAVAVSGRLRCHAHARRVICHIDSSGGYVSAAVDIIAALRAHAGQKIARVRRAESAAFLCMLACDRRTSTTNAQFLHHSAHIDGEICRDKSVQALLTVVVLKAGLPANVAKTLQRWGDADRGFFAPEAKALGLIHEFGSEYYPAMPDDAWRRAVSARRCAVAGKPIGYRDRGGRRMPVWGNL